MKNKNEQVGLFDPFLDTLGGGEKHILSIMEVFAEQGFKVNIFWDKNLSKEIKTRFSLQLINQLEWRPNIFKNKSTGLKTLQTLKTLRTFDYFFYVTNGSYFFSPAKKNFIFAMIPDKNLYRKNLINRLKLFNYRFISNSPFTAGWLKKWGIDSTIILPYIDERLFAHNNGKKEKIILSVGRFFPHLHSKNQEKIISAFNKLKKQSKEFNDYKLILAGGLKSEDQEYFDGLKKLAADSPSIIFKPNMELGELHKLYRQAAYFWHFTGFGVDENIQPEKVEHLGITPLEAMAGGCLTFCFAAGGPRILLKDGKNGFLFTSVDELLDKQIRLNNDSSLKESVVNNGRLYVKRNFSYEVFRNNVLKLLK